MTDQFLYWLCNHWLVSSQSYHHGHSSSHKSFGLQMNTEVVVDTAHLAWICHLEQCHQPSLGHGGLQRQPMEKKMKHDFCNSWDKCDQVLIDTSRVQALASTLVCILKTKQYPQVTHSTSCYGKWYTKCQCRWETIKHNTKCQNDIRY